MIDSAQNHILGYLLTLALNSFYRFYASRRPVLILCYDLLRGKMEAKMHSILTGLIGHLDGSMTVKLREQLKSDNG